MVMMILGHDHGMHAIAGPCDGGWGTFWVSNIVTMLHVMLGAGDS